MFRISNQLIEHYGVNEDVLDRMANRLPNERQCELLKAFSCLLNNTIENLIQNQKQPPSNQSTAYSLNKPEKKIFCQSLIGDIGVDIVKINQNKQQLKQLKQLQDMQKQVQEIQQSLLK